MTIILGHTRHSHDAMKGAARLVSHAGAKLCHANRQVPITLDALPENLNMAGTVHGLESTRVVIGLSNEHILRAELVPQWPDFSYITLLTI